MASREEIAELAMEEKPSGNNWVNYSVYPKDQPWKELEDKVGRDKVGQKMKKVGKSIAEDGEQKIIKKESQEPKGLPHHQVPQPDDFSTEGLEQL